MNPVLDPVTLDSTVILVLANSPRTDNSSVSFKLCSLTVCSQVDDEVQCPDAASFLCEVESWRGRCGVLLALKAVPLGSLKEQRGQTKWIEFVKKMNEKTAMCEQVCMCYLLCTLYCIILWLCVL